MGVQDTPTAVDVHSRQAGEFAASYQALERDPYASCFTYSRMRLEQALEQHLPPTASGVRALDVGCGTGHHLKDLVARGFDVAGVDGSSEMLEEARLANPSAELHHADVQALPFPDDSFDLVLCIEVLRYLPNPHPCIAEIARVLRPGGRCLATAAPLFSVNGYPLINRLVLIAPVGDFVRLKQFFTTPSRLRTQFERAGLSAVEVHGVYTGPINWVERLAPRRLAPFLRRWEGCRWAIGRSASASRPLEHAARQSSGALIATAPMVPLDRGAFTLSLDFELIWGTVDVRGPGPFRSTCETEREVVVDRLLELLAEFGISATWCIVGHLFLSACAPQEGVKHPEIVRPSHPWVAGDWFSHDPCGSEETDPIFYGSSLIERIRSCQVAQEIGCHSFSHVIFGDEGCSRQTATSEVAACVRLARDRGIELRSFAFPRNRVGHLDVLREHGFTGYRGPEPVWYESPRLPRPVKRLGHLADVASARRPPVVVPEETADGIWNLPGSMLYFPMRGPRRYIPLSARVRRAIKGLDRAAAERRIFHLWFHPTNLVDESELMFAGLRSIFEHVDELRRDSRILVAPMGEVVSLATASSRAPA